MSDSNNTSTPQIDLAPTAALLSTGSPKGMYVYFLLAACKNYFEVMRGDPDNFKIENATVALIALCPDRTKREELWAYYIESQTTSNSTLYASVHVVGELISYLSDVLEFLEDSTGALL